MISVTIFLRTIHRSALYLVSILIQRVVYWIICFISTHFEFNSRAKSRLRTVVFNFRLGFSVKGCLNSWVLQIVRKFQFVREFEVVRKFQNQPYSGALDRELFWAARILDTASSFVDWSNMGIIPLNIRNWNNIWNDLFLFILMIAAKNSFIFNKHSLAILEITNIPSSIRSPQLISSFGFLFEMPILGALDPNSTRSDKSDICLLPGGWYYGIFPRLFPKKCDSGTWSAWWLVSLQSWSGWLNPSFSFVKNFLICQF